MTPRISTLSAALFALALSACGGDEEGPPGGPVRDPGPDPAGTPVEYSERISIRLSGIKEDEVRDGQASEDKSLNEESGNPYNDFLRNAEAALGHPPSSVRPVEATLRIGSDTRGVNTFDELFASIEVYLSNSNTTIGFGTATDLTGTSAPVRITATTVDLDALQESLVRDDSVKVGYRGPTVATPPSDFDLRVSIDVMFAAYP
ncbi:MAG: hypothetical protein IT379_39955 [Deltaproteobacteria bacterium]|nr:hypothetical protein [Deltaproteobacteria bacterium]